MKHQYTSVSTHTLEGLRKAEQLKKTGWTVYRTGLFMIYFRKVSQ